MRRIDVDAKHGRGRVRDRRGYEDLRSLADLAQVTRLHVPADVGAHVWPPEPLRDEGSGREEPAMPNAIMKLTQYGGSAIWGYIFAVRARRVLLP